MSAGLVLGTIDLVDFVDTGDDGYEIHVTAEGTTFGSPEAVVRALVSALADGERVTHDRAGNRVASFPVKITGADSAALALGEAALRRELFRPNTLTWTPPDGYGASTVFEVLTSHFDPKFDDLDELRTRRMFVVTLTCAPFARSATLTTVSALSVGGAPSVILFDDCAEDTGWTGSVDDIPADATNFYEAGSVGVAVFDDNADRDADTAKMQRPGAVDFSAHPYLIVDARTISNSTNLIVRADGVDLPLLSLRHIGDDHYEYTFLVSVPSATLSFQHSRPAGDTLWLGLFVYNLTKSNMPPGSTSRQTARILPIGGTERTPGSIHVSAPDGETALGLTIVSTFPDKYPAAGFDPAMSRWYLEGTREEDATTVSGYRFRLDDGFFTAQAPAESFPDGGYQMVGLLAASVEGTYEVVSLVQARQDGVILKEWANSEVTSLGPAETSGWLVVDLGVPTLPILRAWSGTELVLAVKVRNVNGSDLVGVTVEAQDAWMMPVDDDCGLTIVLSDKPHMWLDSPTIETGVQRLYHGDEEDRTGSTFPDGVHTFGQHILTAGQTGMAVITTGVQYPSAEATYYKRWPHNAAE